MISVEAAAVGHDERFRSLVDAGMALARELSLDPLLTRIVETAASLTGARHAALGVIDATGRGLERFITTGISPEEKKLIGRQPHGEGILGLVIRDARPLRLGNLGEHPRSIGFPPGHPEMTSFLGVPIVLQGSVFGNLYLTDKNGGAEFTAEDEESIVLLASQAAVAIANHRMYEAARGWARQLEAVAEIGDVLVSRATTAELNQAIVTEFGGLVDASFVALYLKTEDGHVEVAATEGEPISGGADDLLPKRYLDQLERGATVRVDTLVEDPAVERVVAQDLLGSSLVAVPLFANGASLGCILAICRRGDHGRFNEVEIRAAEVFAARAAMVLELSRRVTRESVDSILRAQERERRHIGLELHDQTGQELTAALLMLRSIENAVGAVPGVAGKFEELRALLTESLRGVRRLSVLLHPPALDDGGLPASVEHLADQLSQRTGLAIRVECGDSWPALGADEESRLYRVIQEALTNVIRHAEATRATVHLAREGRRLTLVVEDDGRGVPVDMSHGVGLSGVRERVALLGGRLEIQSIPGKGTTVRVEVPLP